MLSPERQIIAVIATTVFFCTAELTSAFTSFSSECVGVRRRISVEIVNFRTQLDSQSNNKHLRRLHSNISEGDLEQGGKSGDSTTPPSERTTTTAKPSSSSSSEQDEIFQEASEKLEAVGWSLPTSGDLTSEDPFVKAIDAAIQRDVGVPLDELLNPAKVVNLERDLYALRQELAAETGMTQALPSSGAEAVQFQTTQECDGGGGGPEADQLREKIAKKEKDLAIERRSVFRGWLKTVFLVQAVVSFGLSYVMATNPSSLFGQFDWFYSYNMDISIQVLGYWWWWLFVVPSLRSRRPKGLEKKALDWAFLGTPLISLLAPVVTKDTGIIWTANFAVVVLCYAVAFLAPEGDDDGDSDGSDTPEWLKFVFKSLDFGSGRERGARK